MKKKKSFLRFGVSESHNGTSKKMTWMIAVIIFSSKLVQGSPNCRISDLPGTNKVLVSASERNDQSYEDESGCAAFLNDFRTGLSPQAQDSGRFYVAAVKRAEQSVETCCRLYDLVCKRELSLYRSSFSEVSNISIGNATGNSQGGLCTFEATSTAERKPEEPRHEFQPIHTPLKPDPRVRDQASYRSPSPQALVHQDLGGSNLKSGAICKEWQTNLLYTAIPSTSSQTIPWEMLVGWFTEGSTAEYLGNTNGEYIRVRVLSSEPLKRRIRGELAALRVASHGSEGWTRTFGCDFSKEFK